MCECLDSVRWSSSSCDCSMTSSGCLNKRRGSMRSWPLLLRLAVSDSGTRILAALNGPGAPGGPRGAAPFPASRSGRPGGGCSAETGAETMAGLAMCLPSVKLISMSLPLLTSRSMPRNPVRRAHDPMASGVRSPRRQLGEMLARSPAATWAFKP